MLNVLVACKEPRAPGGLEHIGIEGVDYLLTYSTAPGWSVASNQLLDYAATVGGDALFLDDDTELTAESLEGVREYYDASDLFGLDLHDMSGARQAGARHALQVDGTLHDWVAPGPAYVAHVSTSAIYLKESVLRSSVRFPVWSGIHWEDVAFCYNAWLRGFRILAVPGLVHHAILNGVGSTKRHDPLFWQKWSMNMRALAAWCNEREALRQGLIPVGVREL